MTDVFVGREMYIHYIALIPLILDVATSLNRIVFGMSLLGFELASSCILDLCLCYCIEL